MALDPSELRKAFGSFVTGVTIVTTCDEDGTPRGFTANSYTSVSLDPPIVLVCLAGTASSYPSFAACRSFAINILSDRQRDVSRTFASKAADKFAGHLWRAARSGSPIFEQSIAWLDCDVHERVEMGDHVVLFGRVVSLAHRSGDPLGYHAGNYVSFALEREAARNETKAGAHDVGGIFEKDGCVLFAEPEGMLSLPTGSGLGRHARTDDSLAGVLRKMGTFGRTSFVYSAWDDAASGRHRVFYRGELEEEPSAPEARLIPLDAIPFAAIGEKAVETMVRRYVKERSSDAFGIYSMGAVQALATTPSFLRPGGKAI